MHILDSIILTIDKFNINNESIREKAMELKNLLTEILDIASAQSKTLTDEYLSRQNDLEEQIEEAEKLKSSIQDEMKDFVSKSSDAESILVALRQKQSKFNDELRNLENKKSIADLDSKSISEKITNIRLELKTYEINLDMKKTKELLRINIWDH